MIEIFTHLSGNIHGIQCLALFYLESVHSLSCCDQKQFTVQRFERCLQHIELYNEDTILAKLI